MQTSDRLNSYTSLGVLHESGVSIELANTKRTVNFVAYNVSQLFRVARNLLRSHTKVYKLRKK